jgi:steroid delta-isomerase
VSDTTVEAAEKTPVVTASEASWRCVQAGDKDGWLALMTDDVVIEDPIGPSVTNPDGNGVRGKAAVGEFFDTNIGPNKLTVTREATFPSSSPNEIAYILVLHTLFPNGFTATVRGVFTYKVNDEGLITNLRGFWNMDAMEFGQEEGGGD